ncbi:hypothetical protein [Arthrobacter caoxuetaonis]|uniref:Uncharacterized protein n=1 Tax=Arthrobacter caoxuetaonis TaxID=2886935 RepID=A0A9X1SD67_9MICC|nr:hypothetical protein [Arthrobacter caoxuetaonis]MCC3299365.1 hypothetical protein [Arthrobacter caoxuetaonis]USQ59142.1 hypothetical protein NF551_18725 [Arthrobacter caoxuetaonis]
MDKNVSPEIKAAARDLLGHYNRPGGTQPGGFRAGLFDIWMKADHLNPARLTIAFPEVAVAVNALRFGSDEELQDLAR